MMRAFFCSKNNQHEKLFIFNGAFYILQHLAFSPVLWAGALIYVGFGLFRIAIKKFPSNKIFMFQQPG
jgi:hypothetical protein